MDQHQNWSYNQMVRLIFRTLHDQHQNWSLNHMIRSIFRTLPDQLLYRSQESFFLCCYNHKIWRHLLSHHMGESHVIYVKFTNNKQKVIFPQVTQQASYKKQELLTLREHLDSQLHTHPRVYQWDLCCSSFYFSVLFCLSRVLCV